MKQQPFEFTIDRSRWARGGEPTSTRLLCPGPKKRMCCLGFFLAACGVKEDEIFDIESPGLLHNDLPKQAQWLVDDDRQDSTDGAILMAFNDSREYTEEKREQHITHMFLKNNVIVLFK